MSSTLPAAAGCQVRASLCPYTTLGVSATADEREIKRAYRQLALKYHPDVSSIPDAHVKFLTIQQAYDLLTGKARGKEVDVTKHGKGSSSNGWDFHDWWAAARRTRGLRRRLHRPLQPAAALGPAAAFPATPAAPASPSASPAPRPSVQVLAVQVEPALGPQRRAAAGGGRFA
jgi:hypothetical protein